MTAIDRHQLQRQLGRVLMWARPDGLQVRARRNAWSAMVADSQRRLERAALDVTVARPVAPIAAELRA